MTDVLTSFSRGLLLSLSLCLDLGVVNAAIIGTSLRRGVLAGFAVGFGSCFGDLFYAALSVGGLAVIAAIPAVRWTLWIAGSALLIWMAWRALAAAWQERDNPSNVSADDDSAMRSLGGAFMRGVGLAIASPSSLVWFAAIGGAMIARATGGSSASNIAFLTGFFCAGMLWSFGVAIAFGRMRGRAGPKFAYWAHICSSALFAALAASVIADGIATLTAH